MWFGKPAPIKMNISVQCSLDTQGSLLGVCKGDRQGDRNSYSRVK